MQVIDGLQPITHRDSDPTFHLQGLPWTSTYKVSRPPPEHATPRQGPLPGEGHLEATCLLHWTWVACRMPSSHRLVFYWLPCVCLMVLITVPYHWLQASWILCVEKLTWLQVEAQRRGENPSSHGLGQAGLPKQEAGSCQVTDWGMGHVCNCSWAPTESHPGRD